MDKLEDELRDLKMQMKDQERMLERYDRLSLYNESREGIDCVLRRGNDIIIVAHSIECHIYQKCKEIFFHVYNMNSHPMVWVSEIWAKFEYQHVKKEDATFKCEFTNRIIIEDFMTRSEYENQGYGSILMKEFIEFAKQQGVSIITGRLSWVDEEEPENGARRNHLYEKFGFVIEGERISLDLKS